MDRPRIHNSDENPTAFAMANWRVWSEGHLKAWFHLLILLVSLTEVAQSECWFIFYKQAKEIGFLGDAPWGGLTIL